VKEERNKYIQSYEAKWIFVGSSGGNMLLRSVFGREGGFFGRGKRGSL
jgi:hypothetical protein